VKNSKRLLKAASSGATDLSLLLSAATIQTDLGRRTSRATFPPAAVCVLIRDLHAFEWVWALKGSPDFSDPGSLLLSLSRRASVSPKMAAVGPRLNSSRHRRAIDRVRGPGARERSGPGRATKPMVAPLVLGTSPATTPRNHRMDGKLEKASLGSRLWAARVESRLRPTHPDRMPAPLPHLQTATEVLERYCLPSPRRADK